MSASWEGLGASWRVLGASWGRLGRQIQNRARAICFWNQFLVPFWRGLGASWAPSGTSWRVFLPLLGRLGPVLTKTSKKVRFLKSRKRFFNHFEAFETLKLSVSPRREPYFSKNHFFLIFNILCCSWPVLGALLASFWRSWGALGAILGHLGPGQGKSKRSGQVKSGQVWSRWPWAPPRFGNEARSGQGGVAPSYKDGSA